MLINILIRTSYRPSLFKRCIDSIRTQTYQNLRIIVSYDDDRALEYIPEEISKIRVYKSEKPFFYDDYGNSLKEQVTSGYFFFLDDDDVLASDTAIEQLVRNIKNKKGVICQFSRRGHIKPSNSLIRKRQIFRSKVGMPCLLLHHSLKRLVDFDGSVGAADFHWIKAVSKKVELNFVPLVLVYSESRSNGLMNF